MTDNDFETQAADRCPVCGRSVQAEEIDWDSDEVRLLPCGHRP